MAPPQGQLTKAGVLYHGSDFKEWADRMDAILCLRGLGSYTYKEAKNLDEDSPFYDHLHKDRFVEVMLSGFFVGDATLSRIARDHSHPGVIWEALEAQSKPFRFMDLPPELRNNIYERAFSVWRPYDARGFPNVYHINSIHGRTAAHPLTQVSEQVRKEAFSLFLATQSLRFSLRREDHRNPSDRIKDGLGTWVESMAEQNLKNLRSFRWYVGRKNPKAALKVLVFTFDTTNGIHVQCTTSKGQAELAPHSLARVQEHVARVERDRKLVKLQGECIILALLSEPKLWDDGELEWQV